MSIIDNTNPSNDSIVSEEDVEEYAEGRFTQEVEPEQEPDTTPDPDPDSTPDPDDGDEDEVEEEIDPPSAFDPTSIDEQQYRAFQEFTGFLAENPEFASYVATFPGFYDDNQVGQQPLGAPSGTGAVPDNAQSGALPLPDDLDLDDPAVKALLPLLQQQQTILQSLTQQQEVTQRQLYENQREQTTAIANRVQASFKKQYGLEDGEMEELHTIAGRLQVLPSLMSGVDPWTGMPTKPDPMSAIERAYEMALYSTPKYRNKVIQPESERVVKDNTRKKKLSSLSGNSGSSPRTPAAPRNDLERRNAMISEVTAAMNGN